MDDSIGRPVGVFLGHPSAIDPNGVKAKCSGSHDVPSVRGDEGDILRSDPETVGDERIDFRPRLVHAHGVDGEHAVEHFAEA